MLSICHCFIIPLKKSLITINMHVRVLRIQQKQFLVCIYFYLSYSSLLYFLSLRSCVFHQFWKTLGHLGLKLLVSCFFVIDRNLSVVQLGETPQTYVPLHQLSLQLNLTGSITSPLTYCFVLVFFHVSLVLFLLLFFPIGISHYLRLCL